MIDLPSKKTYRTSVTKRLRTEIRNEANVYGANTASFLEVGADQGYTSIALSDAFLRITSVEIDGNKVRQCKTNAKSVYQTHRIGDNINFVVGTMKDVPEDHWDVVLIDGLHTYEGTKSDLISVLEKNKADTYTVFFHDYWRHDFGVRSFIADAFEKGEFFFAGEPAEWQPNRTITQKRSDYESVFVRFDINLIRKVAQRII